MKNKNQKSFDERIHEIDMAPGCNANDYHAHMARWEKLSNVPTEYLGAGKGIPVKDEDGRTIFRIVVEPSFNVEAKDSIVRLVTHAPEVWRLLRRVSKCAIEHKDTLDQFFDSWELLWKSSGQSVFDVIKNSTDDGLYRLLNVAGGRKLPVEERLKMINKFQDEETEAFTGVL